MVLGGGELCMKLGACWRSVQIVALGAAISYLAVISAAQSADLPPPDGSIPPAAPAPPAVYTPAAPTLVDPGDSFEARFGAYLHGVGSRENDTYDVSGAFLTPRLNFFGVTGLWVYAIPRLQIGGNLNTAGLTSFAYLDAVITVPITRWFFFEPFLGGAIHNRGDLGSSTTADLGCTELFHAGVSLGVPIDRHWRVLATFAHVSNGKGIFGTNCGTNQTGMSPWGSGNQGLNNYGLSIGYAF
jgi:hypothetical protein